jgi:glycosyltransferase involved in cell wall biosynthesis
VKNKYQKISICLLSSIPVTLWSFYQGLISKLKNNDFDVTLISSNMSELHILGNELNCKIFPVEIPRNVSPWKDIISIFKLWMYLLQTHPKIIHAHTPKGGLIGMIASFLARIPNRVYTIHGLPMETALGFKKKALWIAEWVSCKLATTVLAVSPSLMKRVLDERLTDFNKIRVLGKGSACGIDLTKFCPNKSLATTGRKVRTEYNIPTDAIVIGFVGRVVPDKGIKTLVNAFEKLQTAIPTVYLLIIGEFETVRDVLDNKTLDKIRNDTHICYNNKFVYDVLPFYAAIDVVILPSKREGFGLTLIEASALGLPAIATKVTGCVDAVVDGVTGLLVDADNSAQLCNAMLRLAEDSQLRKRLGQNGRRRVESIFDSKLLIAGHINLYRQLLDITV